MPIKAKSTYKKHEYEYESPDGDKWQIHYVENEGRKYIQIRQSENEDMTTWDVAMLLDIADQIRSLTEKPKHIVHRHPKKPNVTDHRGLERSNQIDATVEESMQNYDDDVSPVESFTPNTEWFGVRTGVDVTEIGSPVGRTPADFQKITQSPDWVDRTKMPKQNRPNIVKGSGSDRGGFKRVNASEII